MYASIPDTLRKLHRAGFKIVIFTNQGGIKKSEAKADEIKGKVLRRSFATFIPRLSWLSFIDL
jgi:histidinol phosphatase-like enzyme